MTDCETCNGIGYTAIYYGDNDVICKDCKGTGIHTPAPVVVKMGSYTAMVHEREGLYHLSLKFFNSDEPLTNAWCHDHHMIIAMGRALQYACPMKEHKRYIGWDWDVGTISFTGWLTFRGQKPDTLPRIYTAAGGYEVGVALEQLGEMMKLRREFDVYWKSREATLETKAG